MSSLPVSGQKRKATQNLNSENHKKSRPEDMEPEEWLLKCGTADRVACTKLRKKLKMSSEYTLLQSEDAKKSLLESRVAFLMDSRDEAGISKAAQEAIVIEENFKQEKAAREAEQELLRSTLIGMAEKQTRDRKGKKKQVSLLLKLLLLYNLTKSILTLLSLVLSLRTWAKIFVVD
jgi:hypothetical protein